MPEQETTERGVTMAEQRHRKSGVQSPSTADDSSRGPSTIIAAGRSDRVDDNTIARRAYELYEQRGGGDGHDWDDWLQAEREFRSRAG
jgi:Protein of unknown function (DUF2934)